jgi:hypothetical protein
LLDVPAAPPAKSVGGSINQTSVGTTGKIGSCPDCLASSVKLNFLKQVMLRIREGMATGDAVEAVYQMMLSGSNNNPALLSHIQSAYNYVVDLLS